MRKGGLINKGIAAALTLAFLALVRPEPAPGAFAAGAVALMLYEGLTWCIGYARRAKRRDAARRNRRMMQYDARRWAAEWLTWPLKEVS